MPGACTVWNKRQKGPLEMWKSKTNKQKTKWEKLGWSADMIRSFQDHSKYIQHAFFHSGNSGINDSVFLLLPSPHRPISPAAPDGLVWWLPSQETWPGPSAPVYLSANLPLVQSGRSLAGLVIQQRSKAGSRWRWCDGFAFSRAPLDFLSLKRTDMVLLSRCDTIKWHVWASVWN